MKSFKEVLGVSKECHYINLLDTTTNSFVSFTNVDFETLWILVRKKEIPYDRFVQKQAWMNSTTRMMRNVKISPFLANGNRNYEFKDDGRRTVGNVVYRIQASFNAEV